MAGDALEHAEDEVLYGVKVRAVVEDAVLLGPGVGVDDEEGHVDEGVERPALLAWVEDDAANGRVDV